MRRFLIGLILVAAALAAGRADDPPERPTPAERRALLKEWEAAFLAGLTGYESGDLPRAAAEAEKALAAARRLYPAADTPTGHANLVSTLTLLGRVQRDRGRPADAEPVYRELLGFQTRRHPKGHPDAALARANLAVVLTDGGKHREAQEQARAALAMREELFPGDHPDVAGSLNTLGAALSADGRFRDAEPVLRAALAMRRRLKQQDTPEYVTSLTNLGHALTEAGRDAEAEALFREARDRQGRLPRPDPRAAARAASNLAAVLAKQGDFAEAEALLRDALKVRRELYPAADFPTGHPDLATALNNLAFALYDQDKPAEAAPLFRAALDMRRKLYPPAAFPGGHPDLMTSLVNLAGVLREEGRLDDAERLYREAAERDAGRGGDRFDAAALLNNLGNVLHDRGDYAAAEAHYRAALAMWDRLAAGDHPAVALALGNLASVLADRGQPDAAEPAARAALAMQTRLVAAHARQRSEGDALNLVPTLSLARDTLLSVTRGRPDPAAAYPDVWAGKGVIRRVYELRALAARAAVDPRAAAALGGLSDARRRRAELVLAAESADPPTRAKRAADLAALAARIRELEAGLPDLLPAAAARAERVAAAGPADLRAALPADAVLVDFVTYTRFEQDPARPGAAGRTRGVHYAAFVVTRGGVARVEIGPADPVTAAVAAWREAVTARPPRPVPDALARAVRERVWEPVRKAVPPGVGVVYLTPDGFLTQLPWAALPGDRPGTVLLDDFALAVVPHGQFLLDRLLPAPPPPARAGGVLVVGGVNYDAPAPPAALVASTRGDPPLKAGAATHWPPLPGAAAEGKGVAAGAGRKALPATVLEADRATPAAVLAALPTARVAHLATHGFFADPGFRSAFQVDPKLFEKTRRGERVGAGVRSPLVMTGLVFAGANDPSAPARGIVTGEAVVDLDLSGLELAVLSACQTGAGDVAGGEGAYGLQRAFHLAGCRDVVASLWAADDQATAAVMGEFYTNLWDRGLPPVEALRRAQLAVCRADPGRFAALVRRGVGAGRPDDAPPLAPPPAAGPAVHPALWAGFVLSGPGR